MIQRKHIMMGFLLSVFIGVGVVSGQMATGEKEKPLNPEGAMGLTTEQWKSKLTPQQFHILWKGGTEPAYTGQLLENKKKGIYVSAGCRQPVFHSDHKYESGTGWPSFFQPVSEDAVTLVPDYKLGYLRWEIRSSKCGEHLGHVFKDGPKPTGLRYCINSAALDFEEEKQ